MKKFKLLHIYRGIAAMLVALFHLTLVYEEKFHYRVLFNFFKGGFVGVDFLFVLSGFILFWSYQQDFKNIEKVKNYFIKRFIRVYPPYWAVIFIITLIYTIMGKNIMKSFGMDIFYIVKTIALFPQWPVMIAPVWSLSYEIFFYILFGCCLMWLTKKQTIILFILYIFLLMGINFSIRLPPFYIPLDHFILEFLFGAIAGHIASQEEIKSYLLIRLFFYLSIIVLIVVWSIYYMFDFGSQWPAYLRPFTFGIPFALLTLSSVWMEKKQPLPVPRLILLGGDISYPLFLIHATLISFIAIFLSDYLKISNQVMIGLSVIPVIIITLLASWLFHFAIEKPLRNIFSNFFTLRSHV
ncbi:acyltransferase [Candidatus Roizmanbacteria bacterium]|nr:acyltransferase [Candidatus Roizmanbacteria bacterium]